MKKIIAALWFSLLFTPQVMASPADYVYTPTVEYGEKEIDFKFGTALQPDGSRATASSLGFGYGATENWFTEIYLKHEHEDGTGFHRGTPQRR